MNTSIVNLITCPALRHKHVFYWFM